MIKKISLLTLKVICFFILVLAVQGCKDENPITTKQLGKLIFDVNKSYGVWVNAEQLTKSKELNNDEIIVLRKSIENAKDIKELEKNEMPNFLNCVVFTIKWKDGNGGNLVYQRQTGYMFVSKDFVYREKFKDIAKNPIKVEKYLTGILRFLPSPEINHLIPSSE